MTANKHFLRMAHYLGGSVDPDQLASVGSILLYKEIV